MNYRREIDGLRALAVLPVLLFHAGFQPFSGGYVGVDIFFVISGYLITSIIIAELNTGNFSITKFYERRARRILPALFLVMFACLPFAWIWTSPSALEGFSKSLVAVSLFLSNILFWKEAGYFATANELKPLLHTWSLALEEQYYVLFPIFMMLAWRFKKRWLAGILFATAIASLVLSQWTLTRFAAVSFYLLPTRGWELLIGAMAAFYLFYKTNTDKTNIDKSGQLHQAASLLGLLLIIYSVFAFDKLTAFPGINALPPTIGAMLIVLFATPDTFVGKLLGSKMAVGIGLISYSTYLWHQPLFSFARYGSLQQPSKLMFLLLIIVSLLLAFLTWKFVETPFRDKTKISRKQIFMCGAIGSLFFIVVGLVSIFNKGFDARFNMPASLKSSFGLTAKAHGCFDKPNLATNKDWLCELGTKSSGNETKPDFVVFGDSHSKSMFDAFDEAAAKTNTKGVYTGQSYCAPFLGVTIFRPDLVQADCHLVNERVFAYTKANKIRKIFLIGRWTIYTDGGYYETEATWIGLSISSLKTKAASRQAFKLGLKKTVEAYANIGTQVFIVMQVPQQMLGVQDLYYKIYPNTIIANDKQKIAKNVYELSVDKQKHLKLQSFVNLLFKQQELAQTQAGQLNLVNFDDIFCDDKKCLIGTDKVSFYFDNNHLSTAGGKMLVDEFAKNIIN